MYELNKVKFITERFDSETVLVDVEDGYYYSLSDSGTEIVDLLESGLTAEETIQALAIDSGDHLERQATVLEFIDQLKKESILIPRSDRRNLEESKPGTRPARSGAASIAAPPVLTRYEDMRDILLLDPVHLVDQEFGWPHRQ